MKRNVASQKIGAQMVSATDGSAFTGSVTVYVTGDAGTQAAGSVGSGACTHEGNGYHTYAPAQAETNYDLIAFTFIGTGAVPGTVQVFTSFPQTGDSFALIGATGSGLTTLATAANLATVASYIDTEIADIQARLPAALTAGGNMKSDALAISGDTVAADNAEAFFDGTGYAGTNNVIPTVTAVSGAVGSVTGNVGGNVTGSVGSVATGGISAASFAAGAVDAAAIAADAGTEIATAVWASAARTLTAATNFNNISTSDVLTQVNAAIDTAISELGVAAPTATPTLRTGLMLLYMALRNKLVVQTSGTDALEIYNDAGTKIASKLLTDTGGDYTEAEMT